MNIPFNSWSRERIKQGKKICTSRKKRYTDDKRVTFITPLLPWWFIRTYLFRPEGADSPEELQAVINNIFKRDIEDSEEFYVHFGNFKEQECVDSIKHGISMHWCDTHNRLISECKAMEKKEARA